MSFKSIVKKILPDNLVYFFACKPWLSDEKYLKQKYKKIFRKDLNLENPQTFSEKLQWLKLYNRNPEYTKMVDKYEAKKYVASIIGEEYIVPTYGVWNKFSEIDFESLPNQFVLKTTHDSGGVVICKDKAKFDYKAAKKKLTKSLKRNYYWLGREWPYKNVKPRIIAEKYLEDKGTGELRDYKFFSSAGKVLYLFVVSDRQLKNSDTKIDYFDLDYNRLILKNGYEMSAKIPEKPLNFTKMLRLAETLSKNIQFVRVDFYEHNGNVYFGELTFFDDSGFTPFEPEIWDYKLGEMIHL
ncbi:MAG: ATP-grasp fold amidoligase family protein [Treponema sp.]|nr:ATP-grasp fold amidoligase family protein [Treponema sp.]